MEDRTLSFHTTTAMCWAASVGNMDAIRRLRNEHGVDVNAADYDKRTPLHVAVSDGQVAIVTYLLACGANPNALDRWGRSPMDYAIETKNAAIQEMVASPRYRTFPARSHSKAHVEMFFRAVEEGDTEQVKRSWLRGLEVNVTDEVGRTALHVAVEKGQVDVIELLLSAGVAINVVDANGRSPISIAHETQQVVILDMLRTHQKKILGKDQSKRTSHEDEQRNVLAYQAIKQGNLETFKQLVPEKVCPDTEDYDQRTLLHVASAENQFEIAKYLVECGANVNRLDRWGSSPLSDAIYFAHNELATFLMANHASESGFQTTVATDLLDSATLTRALEFILRVITRDPWLIGQVHCPVLDGDKKCVLVTHNLWHKSNTLMGKQESRDEVGPVNTATVLTDVIQTYRKVSSVVMIDPGQGHIGTVFTGQHPEWLDLDSTQQSHFFLLPHARRAGFRTVVSVPVISKMSTIAVLSWSSVRTVAEDPHELQRMQRVVRSVMILATLRQEVQSAASSTTDARRMSRFLYCQTLDSAITANGELLDAATRRQDVDGGDTLSFALEWGLFDLVDSLATSMSSEDHAAVIPLLRSLVQLLYNGLFDDALRQWSGMETRRQMKTFSLKSLVEACGGKVRTKWALLGHLKYYLQYLYAVSPTEAEVFADVQDLSNRVETFLKKQRAREERAADAVEKSAGSVHKDEKETEKSPDPAPSSTTLSSVSECVLCKYNVPGHIHSGRASSVAARALNKPTPFETKTLKSVHGEKLFGHADNPKSPVYRQIDQLLGKLQLEYDAFERKAELADCCREGATDAMFTSSDLYDAIGAAHDPPVSRTHGTSPNPRQRLLDVMNEILHDTSSLITRAQLLSLHQCLLPVESPQAGVLRTDVAVGYASRRIYRVFLPAGEINDALERLLTRLNETTPWLHRPLLCAYYAFAVLVFYIHPFHDGNGRCARLVGNVICRKLKLPPLLRAADKTIQLAEFLQRAIVTREMLRTSRRQARQTRGRAARRENSSMWF